MKQLRDFLGLRAIVGALPNIIVNGAAVDATPAMANWNWIVSQVNANAASLTALSSTQSSVSAIQSQIATWGPLTAFTPTLAFGGSSAGITYSGATAGFYTIINTIVLFFFTLILTNKGGAVGIASVGGLPLNANASLNGNSPFGALNVNQVTFADKYLTLTPVVGTKTMQIASCPSATPGPNFLTDAAFVNTSSLFGFGFYPS